MKLYTSVTVPNCPSCKMAKNLLNKHAIKYDEIVIGRDMTKDEFLEQYGIEIKTVPQITINQKVIGGYDELTCYIFSYHTNTN